MNTLFEIDDCQDSVETAKSNEDSLMLVKSVSLILVKSATTIRSIRALSGLVKILLIGIKTRYDSTGVNQELILRRVKAGPQKFLEAHFQCLYVCISEGILYGAAQGLNILRRDHPS